MGISCLKPYWIGLPSNVDLLLKGRRDEALLRHDDDGEGTGSENLQKIRF